MSGLFAALGLACGALAWASAAYTLLSVAFVIHFERTRSRAAASPAASGEPPASVALMKPLHGAEPDLRQNLSSFFREAAGMNALVVAGVREEADPALEAVRAAAAELPALRLEISVDPDLHGSNRKISNLMAMARRLGGAQVVVIADSDIRVDPGWLGAVLGALARPGVGVATCPYTGRAGAGFWSRMAAMNLSYQFLPSVICGVGLGLAHPCMGSTIALRRATLQEIGGFEAFRDVLADDYQIGAAVRAFGARSVLAPALVRHVCSEASFGEVFRHELRWARTVRGIDPAGHAGSLLTHPLAFALLALLVSGAAPSALWSLGVALGSRLLLKWSVDRLDGEPTGGFWLLPMRDIVSFLVFTASFMSRSVEWRGQRFHVGRSGELRPV